MGNQLQFKAALFDLDGVLIDSETLYTRFWQKVGQRHHLPSPTFAFDIKGTTLSDILTTYFPDPEIRADVDRMLHEFENKIVYPIFPGALEFVDLLRSKGLKTVIVTSSDNKKMEFLFKQHPSFPKHFDAIITAADVIRSKPAPDPYLIAAAKVCVSPKECLVFEDSFQGLESGNRAGCKVIGLATTNQADDVARMSAMVTPSLGALIDYLDEVLAEEF